jgi:hypothetical protein
MLLLFLLHDLLLDLDARLEVPHDLHRVGLIAPPLLQSRRDTVQALPFKKCREELPDSRNWPGSPCGIMEGRLRGRHHATAGQAELMRGDRRC